jgi:hypothetical protein
MPAVIFFAAIRARVFWRCVVIQRLCISSVLVALFTIHDLSCASEQSRIVRQLRPRLALDAVMRAGREFGGEGPVFWLALLLLLHH